MASIKQLDERKFKITISNGYRPDGRKISKAKTITVPDSIGTISKKPSVNTKGFLLARLTGFEPAALRVGVIRPSMRKAHDTVLFGGIAQNSKAFTRTWEP